MKYEFYLIVLGVVALLGFDYYRSKRRKARELPALKKIDAYRETGQVLMHEQEVPLTERESARIRSRQGWLTWSSLVIVVILLFIFACIFAFGLDMDIYLVASGFALLAGAMFSASYRYHIKIRNKITAGSKTIVRGFITKKYEDSDETTKYYLTIDTLNLVVEKSMYDTYHVGDAVEFHIYKPYYNMVLYHTKLKDGELGDSEFEDQPTTARVDDLKI